MDLNFEHCYHAVKQRDPQYDGSFFTAVKSTGIFCRPICPAITPKPQNCHFFLSAAAALEAGFRPCLRCRPETAPNSPAWNGVKTTVSRALRLIDEGALDQDDIEHFSERLGVGSRHLRRLFAKYVGASPTQVARARRVLTAKKLISDSDYSMTEIAMKSGFKSVRQFNHTIQQLYGRSPSSLRKAGLTNQEIKS